MIVGVLKRFFSLNSSGAKASGNVFGKESVTRKKGVQRKSIPPIIRNQYLVGKSVTPSMGARPFEFLAM
jgi:hypothetical protein